MAGFCHLLDSIVLIMFTCVTDLELVKQLEVASELLLRFTEYINYILACRVQQKTQKLSRKK